MGYIKTFNEFINETFGNSYNVDEIYNELIDFYKPLDKNSEGITIEDYDENGKAIKIPLTTNGDYAITEPDAMNKSKIYCIDIPKKFVKFINGPGLHQYDIEDLDSNMLPDGSEPMCRVLYGNALQFDDIMDIVNKILNVMDPNEYEAVLKPYDCHIVR